MKQFLYRQAIDIGSEPIALLLFDLMGQLDSFCIKLKCKEM